MTKHVQKFYFLIYELSERVSSRSKAREMQKDIRHPNEVHMALQLDYHKHLEKPSPGGRGLLALYCAPTPYSEASLYSFCQQENKTGGG